MIICQAREALVSQKQEDSGDNQFAPEKKKRELSGSPWELVA
jgi:hypothetical protein